MLKPREVHWKVALRILTYIKRSHGKGLLYKKNVHLQIEAFSNSSYVGIGETQSPLIAFILMLEEILVTWLSKKQIVMSRSSVEAE